MKRAFWIIALVLALILLAHHSFGADFRRAETFEDAFNASCRVSVSGARGSGTFIGVDGNKAYILTNYHVVTKNKTARLDFWTNGVRESIEGVIDWRAYDAKRPSDFATVVVNANDLKKIDPPYVALGGSDAKPSVGAHIISSGAPDGRFTQAWKGQVLEYYNDKTCVFTPPPVPGQSGSAICEYVDGELFITGILTWLLGEKGRDDSKGGAIPIANLYQALQRNPSPAAFFDDEKERSPIPANAVECSSPDVQAIELYSSDCKACDTVEEVMQTMADEGLVRLVNADENQGADLARRYGVTEVPTVIILVGDELKTKVNYTDLIVNGPRQAVQKALNDVTSKLEEESKTPGVAEDFNLDIPAPKVFQPSANPPATSTIDSLKLELPTFAAPKGQADFRNRPPVYETPLDVGIFEDSDENWRNRGSARDNNPPSTRPFLPRVRPNQRQQNPQCPIEDENPDLCRPENSENSLNTINNKVLNGLNNLSGNISTSISSEIGKMIDVQTGRAKQFFIAIRDTLISAVIFIIAFSILLADAIKALFIMCIKKLKIVLDAESCAKSKNDE